MKNLALQGEVCHVLPTECTTNHCPKIVAVIHDNDNNNTNDASYIGISNFDNNNNNNTNNNGNVLNPPVSFILTSDGTLIALDSFDNKVWIVDLEKVVEENYSNDEDENDDESNENNNWRINNAATNNNNADDAVSEMKTRSQLWFYGASYTNENSLSDIMGVVEMKTTITTITTFLVVI
jgi:hypothetical protein